MKRTIRQWMGGQDYHDPDDPICASHKGVLSFRGLPVALCYYSYVTGRRHQIVSATCDPKVLRFLKGREIATHPDIMKLIGLVNENPRALSPVGTDALVLRHILAVNAAMKEVGAALPFRSGNEYIREEVGEWGNILNKDEINELTLLFFKLQRESAPPFPYLVKAKHKTDVETIKSSQGWRALGSEWFATRDLIEFTLFKIGRIKSMPIEISY